jgi:hypothetical protein
VRNVLYELTRGFAYPFAKHPKMWIYTILVPTVLWALALAFYCLLPEKPALLGKDGTISSALGLVSTLPGFYFAGLAAVATFGGPGMDNEMPSPPPTLNVRVNGASVEVKLSRRQFLSYLFSYLVIISLILCAAMIMSNMMAPSLSNFHSVILGLKHGELTWNIGKAVYVAIMSWPFSAMIVTTLHGIFFLTEKIHQP